MPWFRAVAVLVVGLCVGQTADFSLAAEKAKEPQDSLLDQVQDLLSGLLEPRQPPAIQLAALETVRRFRSPLVPTILLGAWPQLIPTLRARAVETLLSRPAWITVFLDAVEAGDVGRGDVDPARVQLLAEHPDKKICLRAAELFTNNKPAGRQEAFEAYRKALQLKGHAAMGKQLFKEHCSICHVLEGIGTAIGADLQAIRNRGLEAVLLNTIDPNRQVKPQFLNYIIVTEDGEVVSGMIIEENANSLTIRRADGTNVSILRPLGRSLRARYFEFAIDDQVGTGSFQTERLDLEYAGRFQLGHNWRGELSLGGRWATLENPTPRRFRDTWGPVVGADVRGDIWRWLSVYASARQSFQFGKELEEDHDHVFGIAELAAGIEASTHIHSSEVFFRAGVETQHYSSVRDDEEDYGLLGFAFRLGIQR